MTPFWPSPKKQWMSLGVLNITPDSFSDGGRHLSAASLIATLKEWSCVEGLIPDFGAESSAPMNQAISADLEWQRLKHIFDSLKDDDLASFKALSLDTYKPEVMQKALGHPRFQNFKGQIIWNDVSGVFDESVYELLDSYDRLFYVYTHNGVDSREKTLQHKEFANTFSKENIISKMSAEFMQLFEEIEESYDDRVIFDPGFGFAKDSQTNIYLLENLDQLIKALPQQMVWMIGVSRKSFLQQKLKINSEHLKEKLSDLEKLDHLQEEILNRLLRENPKTRFVFRVHNPLPIHKSLP